MIEVKSRLSRWFALSAGIHLSVFGLIGRQKPLLSIQPPSSQPAIAGPPSEKPPTSMPVHHLFPSPIAPASAPKAEAPTPKDLLSVLEQILPPAIADILPPMAKTAKDIPVLPKADDPIQPKMRFYPISAKATPNQALEQKSELPALITPQVILNPLSPIDRAEARRQFDSLVQIGRNWVDNYRKQKATIHSNDFISFMLSGHYWHQRMQAKVYLLPDKYATLHNLQSELENWVKEFGPTANDPKLSLEAKKKRLIEIIHSKAVYDPRAVYLSSTFREITVDGKRTTINVGGQQCHSRALLAIGLILRFPHILGPDEQLLFSRYGNDKYFITNIPDHDDVAIYNTKTKQVLLGNYSTWMPLGEVRGNLIDPMYYVAALVGRNSTSGFMIHESQVKQKDNTPKTVVTGGEAPSPPTGGGTSPNTFYQGGKPVILTRQQNLDGAEGIAPGRPNIWQGNLSARQRTSQGQPGSSDFDILKTIKDAYKEAGKITGRNYHNLAEEKEAARDLCSLNIPNHGRKGSALIFKWFAHFPFLPCHSVDGTNSFTTDPNGLLNPEFWQRMLDLNFFRIYSSKLVINGWRYYPTDFVEMFFSTYAYSLKQWRGNDLSYFYTSDISLLLYPNERWIYLNYSWAFTEKGEEPIRNISQASYSKELIEALNLAQANRSDDNIRTLLIKTAEFSRATIIGNPPAPLSPSLPADKALLLIDIIANNQHFSQRFRTYRVHSLVALDLAEPLLYGVVLLREDALQRLEALKILSKHTARNIIASGPYSYDIDHLLKMLGVNKSEFLKLIDQHAKAIEDRATQYKDNLTYILNLPAPSFPGIAETLSLLRGVEMFSALPNHSHRILVDKQSSRPDLVPKLSQTDFLKLANLILDNFDEYKQSLMDSYVHVGPGTAELVSKGVIMFKKDSDKYLPDHLKELKSSFVHDTKLAALEIKRLFDNRVVPADKSSPDTLETILIDPLMAELKRIAKGENKLPAKMSSLLNKIAIAKQLVKDANGTKSNSSIKLIRPKLTGPGIGMQTVEVADTPKSDNHNNSSTKISDREFSQLLGLYLSSFNSQATKRYSLADELKFLAELAGSAPVEKALQSALSSYGTISFAADKSKVKQKKAAAPAVSIPASHPFVDLPAKPIESAPSDFEVIKVDLVPIEMPVPKEIKAAKTSVRPAKVLIVDPQSFSDFIRHFPWNSANRPLLSKMIGMLDEDSRRVLMPLLRGMAK